MVEMWAHRACFAALGLFVLSVLDAPFLTVRQKYVKNRWAERLVLASIEVNFVLPWALVVLVLRRDAALAPESWAEALAVLGALVALAGAALAVAGKLTLGRWFTGTFAVKPGHELITRGPYAIVRHPMYTGVLAMVIGCALSWRSAGTLVLAAALVLPLWLHTAIEEPMFEEHFGEAYREYRRRVPRLMPGWKGGA